MIDFHSHILPGVDDGSRDLEMSIEMINNSIAEGVEYICATPHHIYKAHEMDILLYEEKLRELKELFKDKINIISGLEVYINPDLPSLYKNGQIWTINNKNYMLIELPMREYPIYTEKIFYELRLLGVNPIIAHPERNLSIMKEERLLFDLIEQGTLVQMNAGSLTGKYGEPVRKFAKNLVEKNMIHIVGSDGHNNKQRITNIKDAFHIINKLNPSLYEWIIKNQIKIIKGEPIDLVTPKKELKKSFFKFFERSRN